VCITQNLPSYYARLRGRDPRHIADSLLGNFQTKIFHANTDPVTNQYAADLVGRRLQRRYSQNWSDGTNSSMTDADSYISTRQEGPAHGSRVGRRRVFSTSADQRGNHQPSFNPGTNGGSNGGSRNSRPRGGGWSSSDSSGASHSDGGGWSEQMDYTIQPSFF